METNFTATSEFYHIQLGLIFHGFVDDSRNFADLSKISSGWNYFSGWKFQLGQIFRLNGFSLVFEPEDVVGIPILQPDDFQGVCVSTQNNTKTKKKHPPTTPGYASTTARVRWWPPLLRRPWCSCCATGGRRWICPIATWNLGHVSTVICKNWWLNS